MQKLFPVSSLLRALCLMTLLLPTIRTTLVLWTADRWRVTMKSAWFMASVLTVPRTSLLACALIEEAVLLRTRTGVLLITVWVTASSRCRFRESDVPLLSMALQLPGNDTTQRRRLMVPYVVMTRLLAMLPPEHVTPLCIALWNIYALRSITENRLRMP